MKRPITREAHGIADWTYAPLTALAPRLLRFEDEPKAARLAKVLSGLMFGSALLTRAEWGAFKLVPFKAHLAADIGIGVFSLAAPWLAKFSTKASARNTFLFIGISGLIIGGLLSQRKEMNPIE